MKLKTLHLMRIDALEDVQMFSPSRLFFLTPLKSSYSSTTGLKSTHIPPPFNTHIPRPSLKNRIMFLEETARWPVKFSQGIEIQLIAEADEINGRHSYIFLTDRPTDRPKTKVRPATTTIPHRESGRALYCQKREEEWLSHHTRKIYTSFGCTQYTYVSIKL